MSSAAPNSAESIVRAIQENRSDAGSFCSNLHGTKGGVTLLTKSLIHIPQLPIPPEEHLGSGTVGPFSTHPTILFDSSKWNNITTRSPFSFAGKAFDSPAERS
jgi:hypothetical protein